MDYQNYKLNRRQACAILSATIAAGFGTNAFSADSAAGYPDRPVKIIVAYAPGGGNDATARIYAQALGERLKQPFAVENRSGASGIVGTTAAARSEPDGYTLLLGAGGTMTINPSLYTKLDYDPLHDFVPIGLASRSPLVMVIPANLPPNTVAEFIEYGKRAEDVTFASPGAGTPLHLAGELFMRETGLKATHVPYKGSTPAITDLIAGRVDVMFDALNSALPFIRDGRLKALAVTTAQRTDTLPEVPTLQEAGVKDFDVSSWFGLFAPAKTPSDIVELLSTELEYVAELPQTRERIAAIGLETVTSSSQHLMELVRSENVRWREVIQQAGIKLD